MRTWSWGRGFRVYPLSQPFVSLSLQWWPELGVLDASVLWKPQRSRLVQKPAFSNVQSQKGQVVGFCSKGREVVSPIYPAVRLMRGGAGRMVFEILFLTLKWCSGEEGRGWVPEQHLTLLMAKGKHKTPLPCVESMPFGP